MSLPILSKKSHLNQVGLKAIILFKNVKSNSNFLFSCASGKCVDENLCLLMNDHRESPESDKERAWTAKEEPQNRQYCSYKARFSFTTKILGIQRRFTGRSVNAQQQPVTAAHHKCGHDDGS